MLNANAKLRRLSVSPARIVPTAKPTVALVSTCLKSSPTDGSGEKEAGGNVLHSILELTTVGVAFCATDNSTVSTFCNTGTGNCLDELLDDPPAVAITEHGSMYPGQYSLKLMSSLQAPAGQHASKHASLAVMQVAARSAGAGPSGT